jgi:hypothetical protein
MKISPDVTSSSPAIMRSKVDLPQPDGPTKTTNSPPSMVRSRLWITFTEPKLLRTSRSSIFAFSFADRVIFAP